MSTRTNPISPARIALCSMVVGLLTGCGNHDAGGPTQVVAKVGSDEITELQVNRALQRQKNLKADQVDAFGHKLVAGMVEQQLVLQKAHELKLDRDENVIQTVEDAKRDILVHAYIDRIADGAVKPTPADEKAYYDAHPELFAQRRIYTLQETVIQVPVAQRAAVTTDLAKITSGPDLEAYMKARQLTARTQRNTLAAENIPLALLQRLFTVKIGQGQLLPGKEGPTLLVLVSTEDKPVTLEESRNAISASLLNDRRRKAVEDEVASLHKGAKIEYLGKYADLNHGAASAPAATVSTGASAPAADAVVTSEASHGASAPAFGGAAASAANLLSDKARAGLN